jgi:adenylate cyclase class 2
MNEIEIKFLDIDPVAIESKLLSKGAKKLYDCVFEEWIFQKPEWKKYHGRVRVRVEKDHVTVAYKETTKKTGDGNPEIEFEVSDKEQAIEFINKLGIPILRHQQKRRIHFILDGVAVDIDFWPRIPPLIEIEGESKRDIERVVKTLGFLLADACELDARRIIVEMYHVDLDSMKEYVFK